MAAGATGIFLSSFLDLNMIDSLIHNHNESNKGRGSCIVAKQKPSVRVSTSNKLAARPGSTD
jgi:hypothetical protein